MEHPKTKRRIRLTAVSALHYFRLVYRGALFLAGLSVYLVYRLRGGDDVERALQQHPAILIVISMLIIKQYTLTDEVIDKINMEIEARDSQE